jgi:hypothetical protein
LEFDALCGVAFIVRNVECKDCGLGVKVLRTRVQGLGARVWV